MFKNGASKSRVPALLRTAVLLRRQERDTGLFVARVEVKSDILMVFQGVREEWWTLTGGDSEG